MLLKHLLKDYLKKLIVFLEEKWKGNKNLIISTFSLFIFAGKYLL